MDKNGSRHIYLNCLSRNNKRVIHKYKSFTSLIKFMSRLFCFYFTHQVQLTCILQSYMYVNYVDYGTAVARTNKVNTNAHDASGIFRDVYIQILGKVCRLRDCGSRIWWMIFQWPGILKFSHPLKKKANYNNNKKISMPWQNLKKWNSKILYKIKIKVFKSTN